MSLADYLAKNYLTADAPKDKKSKKRKRKDAAAASSGLTIADDDEAANAWARAGVRDGDEDDDAPTAVLTTTTSTPTSTFRKSSNPTWKRIGLPPPATNSEQAAADAILASAAAESASRAQPDDERPEVVGVVDNMQEGVERDRADRAAVEGVQTMSSGAHAGLQTGRQVAEQIRRRQEEERRAAREVMADADADAVAGAGAGPPEQETIYRDASGRIINVAMKRAEARRKAAEEERKAAETAKALKGEVQLQLQEERKKQLEDARYMTVARGADDVELNEEMKAEERWADPAMRFVLRKEKRRSRTGKLLYQGAAPPNRWGIRPGHRWDGVDRSNGFEGQWFRARNAKRDRQALEHMWQMDE